MEESGFLDVKALESWGEERGNVATPQPPKRLGGSSCLRFTIDLLSQCCFT